MLSSTDIKEIIETESDFEIYPNPSDNNLYFQNKLYGSGNLVLINSLGQDMYNSVFTANEKLTININALPAGIYLLRIQTSFKTILKKIVIQ